MNNNYIVGGVVALVVVLGVLFFVTQNKQEAVITPAPQAVEPVSTIAPSSEGTSSASDAASASNTKEIIVEGSPYKFLPAEIKVKKGQSVKIVFKNTEGFHDFVIDEFKAKTKQIKAGETETIEFVADKIGTYEYYCSVGKHRAMGMKGNLIVE